MFHFKLDGSEIEIPSGTDNATEISTSHFLVISVADAAATSSP
jgi:hypothetical protein